MEVMLIDKLVSLLQVIFIDLVLAGDNAIVVGMAAAAVPADQRKRVIVWGAAAAVLLLAFIASVIARLIHRHRWLAWVGLAIISYVAIDVIVRGSLQVAVAIE